MKQQQQQQKQDWQVILEQPHRGVWTSDLEAEPIDPATLENLRRQQAGQQTVGL